MDARASRTAFAFALALSLFLLPARGLAGGEPAAVRRVADTPAHVIAGGKGSAAILFDAASGSPEAAMTVLVLGPGAAVPEHVHEGSVELLYVMEGEAEMTLGGEPLRVSAGSAVRIPMGVKHSARVVGEKALRGVQVYTPAGPEQRFKAPAAPAPGR